MATGGIGAALEDVLFGLDRLDEPDEISALDPDEIYDQEMAAASAAVATMPTVGQAVEPDPGFDPEYNLLDPEVRARYQREETIYLDNDLFTNPTSTTDTLEGSLSNVTMHESDLINKIKPDSLFVAFKCNYGSSAYPLYTPEVPVKKSNRGRKKNPKKTKIRRVQGTGGSFNSQVTFIMRSLKIPDPDLTNNGVVPYGTKVYKFKVFRNGKLQLPGVQPGFIDDVIACSQQIALRLNSHFHAAEPVQKTLLLNINPVMRNYKFATKLAPRTIIDLRYLSEVIAEDQKRDQSGDVDPTKPHHPQIFLVKYDRQDTKLAIRFKTGIYKKPNKTTRVNIFMRGKINILGAFMIHTTKEICEYLYWVFKTYPDVIVSEDVQIEEKPEANVLCSDEEANSIIKYFSEQVPPEIRDIRFTDEEICALFDIPYPPHWKKM